MKSFLNSLTVYIVIVVLGIGAYYLQNAKNVEHIWDYWGVLDTSSAVALAILAGLAYWDYIKGENIIKIYFLVNGKKIDTGLSLLRKDFSRSELLGILGMIKLDPKERYKLLYFQNPTILKEIQKIQKGKGNEFTIELEDDELKYFKLK